MNPFLNHCTRRITTFATIAGWAFAPSCGSANARLLDTAGKHAHIGASHASDAHHASAADDLLGADVDADAVAHDAHSRKRSGLKACDAGLNAQCKLKAGVDLTDPGLAPFVVSAWNATTPVAPGAKPVRRSSGPRRQTTFMKRATPKLRDFAERLIYIVSIETKFSGSRPPAVFTVIDKLRPYLVQVVGDLGFSAVLSRALAVANADVAWLRAVHVKPDGSLNGLDELEAEVFPKEIAEGRIVVLAEFVSLLVELIGERLVLQLVHQAMPEVSKDDLYFGEGSEREKI